MAISRVGVPFTFAFYPPFELGGDIEPVTDLRGMGYCGYCDGKPLDQPNSDQTWDACSMHEAFEADPDCLMCDHRRHDGEECVHGLFTVCGCSFDLRYEPIVDVNGRLHLPAPDADSL